MNNNKIQTSVREIKTTGRLPVCVKADKTSIIGAEGTIEGTITDLNEASRTIKIPYVIVEPKDRDTNITMMKMPLPTVAWVDRENPEHSALWHEMIDHTCFKGITIEDIVKRISFELNDITSDNVLVIKANEQFPEYQRCLALCKTDDQRSLIKDYIEKKLNNLALIDVMNTHYPVPVEGDEFWESDECTGFVEHTKFRCHNNAFMSICFRASDFIKESFEN